VPELVRGKSGRVFGNLMAMLTVMKSLPLAYNRDMQEDKAPLFDAADTLTACLQIYIQLLPKIKFNRTHMEKAASQGYLNATDLADYLATKGMPFREAHYCVGQIVSHALRHKKEIQELSLAQLQKYAPQIEDDIFDHLAIHKMIDRRSAIGGTATVKVKAAISHAQKKLKKSTGRKSK
jgi:argininosuccinate lyase